MSAAMVTDLPANMQTKIAIEGDCWTWTGAKNPKGYGSVSNGRKGASALAHRKAYMHAVGDIPYGYELDHLCENTSCVNPGHLEAVTPEEHRRRIGHKDLAPLYATERVADPGFAAIVNNFLGVADTWRLRHDAKSPEDRALDDARRHRLHLATGVRCSCEGALA